MMQRSGWTARSFATGDVVCGTESVAERAPDGGTDCVALQAPFQMVWPELKTIGLAGETIVLRSALNVDVKGIVHLDRTTHAGAPFTNDGDSIGSLENAVLVIDTRNFARRAAPVSAAPCAAQ
jgi:hypothetical protein